MRTLLVTGKPLAAEWASKFEELGFKVINGSAEALRGLGVPADEANRELSESELASCLQGVEVYVYGGLEPASRKALKEAQDLKFISFLGTGWSDPGCIDADAAAGHGIQVSNTPHANALSVAEFAFGAIVAASRHMYYMAAESMSGRWEPTLGSDVSGRMLGIVGLGAIGSRLARLARLGADMDVRYFGPHGKPDLEELLRIKRANSLSDLFANSDIVSVHAPSGPDTEKLITASEFSAAQSPLILVNTAVPEIIDGEALRNALEDGTVKCAVFDGKYPDPELDQALLAMGPDRYIQFPRSAWLTAQSYDRMAAMSHSSVSGYVQGERSIPFLVLNPG